MSGEIAEGGGFVGTGKIKIGPCHHQGDEHDELDGDQSGEGILPVAEGKPFVKMLGDGHDEGGLRSIQRLPVRFVPIKYQQKSGNGPTEVGKVRNVIAADAGHATK